jgi:hypothetical protein
MGGYNIDMDLVSFLQVAGVLGLVLFIYTFRAGLTDFVYLALNNLKATVFMFTCLIAGLLVGVYASGADTRALDFSMPSFALPMPSENPGVAQIDSCKEFIAAKSEGRAGYIDPQPTLSDKIIMGADSYWDVCAQTFGMNYWKHNITIGGKNGGQILCDAYRKDSYRSGIVESWCSTVLSPKQPKPKIQKASSRRKAVPNEG